MIEAWWVTTGRVDQKVLGLNREPQHIPQWRAT